MQTDTHFYDGKWRELYRTCAQWEDEHLVPRDTFAQTCGEIREWLLDGDEKQLLLRSQALASLKLMEDAGEAGAANFDSANDVHVADILPRVWRLVRRYDPAGLHAFLEQLADISGRGPCPPGRTTRLFHFYSIHLERPSPADPILQHYRK